MFKEAVVAFRCKDLYPIKVEMSQNILDSFVDEITEEYYSHEDAEYRKKLEEFKKHAGGTVWGIEIDKGNIFGFYMHDDKGTKYNCLNREWI
jgi:hypothetical protein